METTEQGERKMEEAGERERRKVILMMKKRDTTTKYSTTHDATVKDYKEAKQNSIDHPSAQFFPTNQR